MAIIRPSQIKYYVYGWWQYTQEIQKCMEGIIKMLQIDPPFPCFNSRKWAKFYALEKRPLDGPAPSTSLRKGPPANRPSPDAADPSITGRAILSRYICAKTTGPS